MTVEDFTFRPIASISRSSNRRLIGAGAWFALVAVVAIVAVAVVGPTVWTADGLQTNLINKFSGPTAEHPLGTDNFGRDILARLMAGARLSLVGGASVLIGSTFLGILVGGFFASIGGKADAVASRTIDALLSLPSLVIALGIVGVFGKSFENLLFALILTSWPWYARIYRGLVLKERSETYVAAALAIGCGPVRIAWRHIGPNIVGPSLVIATVNLGNAILSLASLSFLGLGVAPPTAEWGAMVNDARLHFQTHPWVMVAPGLAISITVVSVNLLGDALRDFTDPRTRLNRRYNRTTKGRQ